MNFGKWEEGENGKKKRILYNYGLPFSKDLARNLDEQKERVKGRKASLIIIDGGIGEGKTREDHRNISNQLYAAYTYVKRVETLASIIGESELSDLDKKYLDLGRQYETTFVNQGISENRSIEETLNLIWKLVSILPRRELTRVTDEQLDLYGH